MFANYGILDLEYSIDNIGCSVDRPGLGVLRDLALVDSPPDEDGIRESDLIPDLLDKLATQVELGAMHLKIFLEAPEMRARGGIPSRDWRRPKITLPQQLLVVDACITNAPGVWRAKHLYLSTWAAIPRVRHCRRDPDGERVTSVLDEACRPHGCPTPV